MSQNANRMTAQQALDIALEPRDREDWESVCSDDGTITHNFFQQGPVDCTEHLDTPVECAGTTNPWGI